MGNFGCRRFRTHGRQPIRCALATALLAASPLLVAPAIFAAGADTPPASMIPPYDDHAAADAKYQCPKATSVSQQAAMAASLGSHTYRKNDLACAADFRVAIANASPNDLEGAIAALEALMSYTDHVRALDAFDLGRVHVLEHEARLERSRRQAAALLPHARDQWPNDPRILALTAVVDLNTATGEQHADARTRAIESMQKSIQLDASASHGLAQRRLAQIYLDLPPLLGGDTRKALEYFTAAEKIAPGDIRALNGIAACNLELGRSSEAAAALHKVAQIGPSNEAERQLFVDEWRTGEGFASRLGDDKLAHEIGERRAELLKAHPELLPRNSDVVLGHGGSNPITGDRQYVGDVTRPKAQDKKAP